MVQEFLDRQATDFGARYEITDEGGIIYYFPTALSLISSENELNSLSNSSAGSQFNDAVRDQKKNCADGQVSKEEISKERKSQNAPREKLNNKKQGFSSLVPQLLTQVQLASRLKVHPSTISKRKTKPDFIQGRREKDPEAIAWEYSQETKRFSPRVLE